MKEAKPVSRKMKDTKPASRGEKLTRETRILLTMVACAGTLIMLAGLFNLATTPLQKTLLRGHDDPLPLQVVLGGR